MAVTAPWIWAAVSVVAAGLLWRRQWAVLMVVICASYGAVRHDVITSPIPSTIHTELEAHRAKATERGRRVACERRALSALNRGDDHAFAQVRRDCPDMIQEVDSPDE